MQTPNERLIVQHVSQAPIEGAINLYCGRGAANNGRIKANLGNPFPMSNESQRGKVCAQYDAFLHAPEGAGHRRILERVIQRVNEGAVVTLACHCHPKQCHCDTLRDYVLTNVQFG